MKRGHSIFLIFALLCFSVGLYFTQSASAESAKLTTLRAKRPTGVFENIGGITYIIDGSVQVKNAGSYPAKDVRVMLKLPGSGQSVKLSGPSSLAPNKSSTYRSRLFEVMTSTKKLKAVVSCSNCR